MLYGRAFLTMGSWALLHYITQWFSVKLTRFRKSTISDFT